MVPLTILVAVRPMALNSLDALTATTVTLVEVQFVNTVTLERGQSRTFVDVCIVAAAKYRKANRVRSVRGQKSIQCAGLTPFRD